MDAIKCAISLRDVTRSPTQNESEREERERGTARGKREGQQFSSDGTATRNEWMAMTALRSTPTVGAAVKWDDEGGREGRTEVGG